MRKLAAAAGAIALAFAQPLAAQEATEDEAFLAAMMQMFQPAPLTPEQEERLPAAREVVGKIMPPGTMAQVMWSMFDQFLGPLTELEGQPSANDTVARLGFDVDELELGPDQAAEVAALLDPVWRERQALVMAAVPDLVAKLMNAMEPGMRKAMADAYAVHFDRQELADIAAFFSTPSGASYAAKSYVIASDPRIMGAVIQDMPTLMASMGEMEAEMEALTAHLPSPRGFADLDAAQRARLSQLTGLAESEIEEGMARAAGGDEGVEFEGWDET
jgi:hypothetical protein